MPAGFIRLRIYFWDKRRREGSKGGLMVMHAGAGGGPSPVGEGGDGLIVKWQ